MINKDIVYKIRYIPLLECGDQWVKGVSVIPKLGGSGKTFTSKAIVNRMLKDLKTNRGYGKEFVCEIVTFKLEQLNASADEIK
tara:strand:+ start:196 stop:444 length:249 start_codon:yes stop_codon:yes gene_type:complete